MWVYWDVKTGKPVLSQSRQAARVFWDASGPQVAFVTQDTRNPELGGKDGKEVAARGWKWWEVGRACRCRCAWSSDRRRLALIINSSAIEVREIPSGTKVLSLAGQRGLVSLAWSPDDRRLAAFRSDASVEVWDVATGQSVVRIVKGGKAPQRPGVPLPPSWSPPLTWSPDGKRLAADGENQSVVIWDVATGKELTRLSGHEGDVLAMAWVRTASARDGSVDRTLKVWEAATGKKLSV